MAPSGQGNHVCRDVVLWPLRACLVALSIGLAGCSTIIPSDQGRVIHASQVSGGKQKGKQEFILASYGADQRTFVKLGNQFCNESAPDAPDRTATRPAQIGISLGNESAKSGGNGDPAEIMAAIVEPSQKTQQFRAVGYRICEAALNGWIDKKDVAKLLKAMVEKLGE